MAYIANRPVRFDREYKIGEIVPADVIAPGMVGKLVAMGRILRVDIPGADDDAGAGQNTTQSGNTQDNPVEGADLAQDGDEATEGGIVKADTENANVGQSGDNAEQSTQTSNGQGEYPCPVCGKIFKSKNALAAHSKSHKE